MSRATTRSPEELTELDRVYREGVGVSVLAVRGVMPVGRMSRPECGWIDRTGRALGARWLLVVFLSVSLLQAD
jgi:hypothetical protein